MRSISPGIIEKGGGPVSPYNRDLTAFVDACTALLDEEVTAANLTVKESQLLQYYLAAMTAKFPALIE